MKVEGGDISPTYDMNSGIPMVTLYVEEVDR
jgi:hypothetical protein